MGIREHAQRVGWAGHVLPVCWLFFDSSQSPLPSPLLWFKEKKVPYWRLCWSNWSPAGGAIWKGHGTLRRRSCWSSSHRGEPWGWVPWPHFLSVLWILTVDRYDYLPRGLAARPSLLWWTESLFLLGARRNYSFLTLLLPQQLEK